VEVSGLRSSVRPRYDNGFYFDVRVRIDAKLTETYGKDLGEKEIEEIRKAAGEKIRESIEATVGVMRREGADFMQWYKPANARFPAKFREGGYEPKDVRVNIKTDIKVRM